MNPSQPLQVYLDDADLARLDACARERGWTKSQVMRAALRAFAGGRDRDSLLAASGMIDGLPTDGSERFDAYLQQTYVAERPAADRRRRVAGRVRR